MSLEWNQTLLLNGSLVHPKGISWQSNYIQSMRATQIVPFKTAGVQYLQSKNWELPTHISDIYLPNTQQLVSTKELKQARRVFVCFCSTQTRLKMIQKTAKLVS